MLQSLSVHRPAKAVSLLIAGALGGLLIAQVPKTEFQVSSSPSDMAEVGSVMYQTASPPDNNRLLLAIAAIGVGVAGAVTVARGHKDQASNGWLSGPQGRHSQHTTTLIDQTSRRLQKKLLRVFHDDRGAASRLLAQTQFKHPNRSLDWCAEKVIYDLERDRGRY